MSLSCEIIFDYVIGTPYSTPKVYPHNDGYTLYSFGPPLT